MVFIFIKKKAQFIAPFFAPKNIYCYAYLDATLPIVAPLRRAPNRAFFCVSPCAKSCFFLRSAVRQIVLFSAFRRAPNRAFFCVSPCAKSCFFSAFRRAPNRAFFCVSPCAKSCFFLRFTVHQIVLFSAFRRAPNRAFFCVSPCAKSCFFLRFAVRQIVLFSAFRRAPNRAFFCVSPCAKSCFFLRFAVRQIVLFSAFRRNAPNRAFFCVSPCAKSCFFLRFAVRQIVLFSAFRRAPNRALLAKSSLKCVLLLQHFVVLRKNKTVKIQSVSFTTVFLFPATSSTWPAHPPAHQDGSHTAKAKLRPWSAAISRPKGSPTLAGSGCFIRILNLLRMIPSGVPTPLVLSMKPYRI